MWQSLSDERAVRKGTGAQGIDLHVEQYCFKGDAVDGMMIDVFLIYKH